MPQGNQPTSKPPRGLQATADFNQCVADRIGALGFAIDQLGSLLGAQLNAQQSFTNSTADFLEGAQLT